MPNPKNQSSFSEEMSSLWMTYLSFESNGDQINDKNAVTEVAVQVQLIKMTRYHCLLPKAAMTYHQANSSQHWKLERDPTCNESNVEKRTFSSHILDESRLGSTGCIKQISSRCHCVSEPTLKDYHKTTATCHFNKPQKAPKSSKYTLSVAQVTPSWLQRCQCLSAHLYYPKWLLPENLVQNQKS